MAFRTFTLFALFAFFSSFMVASASPVLMMDIAHGVVPRGCINMGFRGACRLGQASGTDTSVPSITDELASATDYVLPSATSTPVAAPESTSTPAAEDSTPSTDDSAPAADTEEPAVAPVAPVAAVAQTSGAGAIIGQAPAGTFLALSVIASVVLLL